MIVIVNPHLTCSSNYTAYKHVFELGLLDSRITRSTKDSVGSELAHGSTFQASLVGVVETALQTMAGRAAQEKKNSLATKT